MERSDRDQERPFALRDGHAPGRHRAAVAHPVDCEIQGLFRSSGVDEVRVQRLRVLSGHGCARGEEGLGDRLSAEDPIEAAGFADHAETVVAPRLELECSQQSVERDEDRLLEGSLSSAGVLGPHGGHG